MRPALAFILPALFGAVPLSALAGVAPTSPNSALSQSGARIAAAKPVTEDREDKKEHDENAAKDLAK